MGCASIAKCPYSYIYDPNDERGFTSMMKAVVWKAYYYVLLLCSSCHKFSRIVLVVSNIMGVLMILSILSKYSSFFLDTLYPILISYEEKSSCVVVVSWIPNT